MSELISDPVTGRATYEPTESFMQALQELKERRAAGPVVVYHELEPPFDKSREELVEYLTVRSNDDEEFCLTKGERDLIITALYLSETT